MVTNNTLEPHCVKIPENHIVIDFDIKSAGSSKSDAGVHLHYMYTGSLYGLGFADCREKGVPEV